MDDAIFVGRASFLGLPTELRLQIYSYLRCAPMNATVMEGFRDGWEDHAFQTTPIRADTTRINIPWLNLMLTSRAIAAEMKADAVSGRAAATAVTTSKAQTYSLSISARWNLDAITWTRIPCPPEDVRVLDVTFHAPCDLRFWGDGGPRGIVRSLYQTLNLFLHCGPMLQKGHPLKKHISLKELILRMDVSHHCCQKDDLNGTDGFVPPCARLPYPVSMHPDYIQQLANQLCNTGLLSGYVYRLTIHGTRGSSNLLATQIAKPCVPERWDGYGFEWGVDVKMDAAESQQCSL
nr:hypothetical protein CFP56_00380 [Quercus suber]